MNSRRTIGSILALALLVGQTFVPLARAACAVPKAKTSACPSCTVGPSAATPSVTVDRSCCAAPGSMSDRDPAMTAPDRSSTGDHRVLAAALILSAGRVLMALVPAAPPGSASDPPGSAPPLLRTTILLI